MTEATQGMYQKKKKDKFLMKLVFYKSLFINNVSVLLPKKKKSGKQLPFFAISRLYWPLEIADTIEVLVHLSYIVQVTKQ